MVLAVIYVGIGRGRFERRKMVLQQDSLSSGVLLYCVDLSRAGAPCVRSCIIKPGNGPATDCERYTSVSLYACSCTLHDDTKGRLMGVFAGSPGMLVV